ncbi:MAG: c-type cytochrome [Bacteroidia bacterium]
MINLKTLALGIIASAAVAGFTSCKEVPNSPGYEFMPDMYRSQGLRYYGEHTLNGDTLQIARKPVEGTISRDHLPSIPKGMSYEDAGLYLKNPLTLNAENDQDGDVLYGKFCVHCHGDAGKGDGKVGQKLPGPPPAYDGPLKNLPEGKIYYSISKGKGTMGPHELLLSAEERWKLVLHVQKLQGPKVAATDSTKVAEVKPPAKK